MGVYIHGMEMPEDGETITLTICADGLVFEEFKEPGDVFQAVPVPQHGRLGDLDKLERGLRHMAKYQHGDRQQGILGCCETIRLAPTIIPAEPCNNLSKPCKEDEA